MRFLSESVRQRGFTLIELLVVISIIGFLASIVLVSLNSAREKARIARVQMDLKQYQTALELYYDDNGKFPCLNEGSASVCLNPALLPYGRFPAQDPWGIDYQWHNPGCCVDECNMILSAGPDKKMCTGGLDLSCEHVMSQTSNCSKPSTSYDDTGMYFGQVKNHQ